MEKVAVAVLGAVALVAIAGMIFVFSNMGISGKVVGSPYGSEIVVSGTASDTASDIDVGTGTAFRSAIGHCPRADVDPNAPFVRLMPIYSCREYCNVASSQGVGYALKSMCSFNDASVKAECQAMCQ